MTGYSQEFRAVRPEGLLSAPVQVLGERRYDMGRWHEMALEIHGPAARLNPGELDRKPYALVHGERELELPDPGGVGLAFGRMRERIDRYFETRYAADEAALLSSVTTSGRGLMSPAVRAAFSNSGLAHMLSISGSHFGLLIGVLYFMSLQGMRLLPGRALERMALYVSVRQAAALLTLPALAFYLGLSGASVPALRSVMMVGLTIFGLFLGRRGDWLNMLLLAASLIVLWDPSELGSLSFELSFLAVLFICMFIKDREPVEPGETGIHWAGRATIKLRDMLIVGVAAVLGTAPLTAYHFHNFSVVSPVANLLIDPLMGMLMVPLALFGSIAYLLTGWFPLSDLLGLVARWSLDATLWMGTLKYGALRVPNIPPIAIGLYYAGFVAAWATRFRPRAWLYALGSGLCLAAFAALAPAPRMSVTFLDAGQADAAVIETARDTVVVDTGRTGREVGRYLRWRGIGHIDALALSHGHVDHCGGTGYLAEAFGVDEIWDNGMLQYPDAVLRTARIRGLSRGDVISSTGGAEFSVFHPPVGYEAAARDDNSDTNDHSLVLRLHTGALSVMFGGDTEDDALGDMLSIGPDRLHSLVLKAPHHGHVNSETDAFLDAVDPGFVVVNAKIREPIEDRLAGARVLYPPLDGAVRIEEAASGRISVRAYGDYLVQPASSAKMEWANLRRLFMAW